MLPPMMLAGSDRPVGWPEPESVEPSGFSPFCGFWPAAGWFCAELPVIEFPDVELPNAEELEAPKGEFPVEPIGVPKPAAGWPVIVTLRFFVLPIRIPLGPT